MSSSPIEAPAPPAGLGAGGIAETRHAVQDPRWHKRILPRTLFGRSLLIIVTPLILVQLIATWIFYDRVWDTVSRRFSSAVAGEISEVVQDMSVITDAAERTRKFERAGRATEIEYIFWAGEKLPSGMSKVASGGSQDLVAALTERVRRPFQIDDEFDPRDILVTVALPDGVLQAAVPKKRLFTPTTYIFVLWMTGSSLVLFAVATLFMRNQVKSLRRLAVAAESFGKGRDVPNFRLAGATEVRRVGAAFLLMRERIQRQISQRTEMLAGVSHDLRTPLTRMRLALEFLGDNPTVAELRSDVTQMQGMVQGYLDFARGEGGETPREADLPMLLDDVVANARRDGAPVTIAAPEAFAISVRPDAMKRCVANLIANARRYGSHVWVTAVPVKDGIDVLVDDDGPGIPAHRRDDVFRPFFRLDAARSPQTGSVGLGLTIARDVALSHGGDISLEDSPQGGLRVRVHLPV
ncbi:MAG TPA: ATP-binding protein [Stellaceae bacterium]|nr:ATP-binding protein [Stellaceae bacterium]